MIDGDTHREILMRLTGGIVSFGGVAVGGFFLLSGFLILQSWQRTPKLIDFVKNRVLRIYPGFVVASLVSAFVVGPLGANPSQYFAEFRASPFFKQMLILGVPLIPPVFVGQPYPVVNGSMWTIGYEFRCYIFVALLGICGVAGRRKLWAAMTALLLLLSFYPSAFIKINKLPDKVLRYLIIDSNIIFHFLAFFCAGCCFYLFRDKISYRRKSAVLASALLIPCLFQEKTAQLGLISLGAYCLFWFAFADIPLLRRFRTFPDISYGVYLYGWPSQKILMWYVNSLNPYSLFVLSLLISFICGWISWHLVERPFMRFKKRSAKNGLIEQTTNQLLKPL